MVKMRANGVLPDGSCQWRANIMARGRVGGRMSIGKIHANTLAAGAIGMTGVSKKTPMRIPRHKLEK